MTTKEKLLAFMKQQPKTVFSGERLANTLDVSRTAIWKAIRELEKKGYQFDHLANGYRYIPADILAADELILPELPQDRIFLTDHSPSTMNDARHYIPSGQPTPALFLTEAQSAGHGRFGRPFFSPSGQIYMSLLLQPNQTFEELPQYTLLAAVAVAQAIDELTGFSTDIKWVNDIYLAGQKVCGILTEATSDIESGRISHIIIGIGLNFSIKQEEFPTELQQKATSLFKGEPTTVLRNQLIHLIWQNFFDLLAHLPDQSYMSLYRQKSFVLGKTVHFTQQNKAYSGIATAITNTGELIVATSEGEKVLASGEISLAKIEL